MNTTQKSLRTVIGGAFAAVMLGTLVLAATAIYALLSVQTAQVTNSGITDLRRAMYDARIAATRFSLKYAAEDAGTAKKGLVAVGTGIKAILPSLTTAEAESLKKTADLLEQYSAEMQAVQDAVEAKKPDAEVTAAVTAWRATGAAVVENLGKATELVGARMGSTSSTAVTTVSVLAVAVLLAGTLLAWRMTLSITRPIISVRGALAALAAGDLTGHIEVTSRHEVGAMSADLNTTIDSLRRIVASIGANSTGIASSSEELSAVSTQMSTSAATVASQSDSVAASATQVSQSIGTFASGVEEMNASVVEISKNATAAAQVAKEGVQASTKAQAAVNRLSTSSVEIGDIVKMITDIAAQTNLLALNATIEAARAGDAGRGFAVVASEVKVLARKTAEATADIRKRVEGIQGDTGAAAEAIKQLGDVAERVNGMQQSIAGAVEEQSATTREMSGNVAQVAQGGADIAKSITAVSAAAKEASSAAADTLASAKELARHAAELHGIVGKFKV